VPTKYWKERQPPHTMETILYNLIPVKPPAQTASASSNVSDFSPTASSASKLIGKFDEFGHEVKYELSKNGDPPGRNNILICESSIRNEKEHKYNEEIKKLHGCHLAATINTSIYLGNAKIPDSAMSCIENESKIFFQIKGKGISMEFKMTPDQLEGMAIPSLLINKEYLNGTKTLEYIMNISNRNYIIMYNVISYICYDYILLVPQFIVQRDNFNRINFDKREKKFIIYGVTYSITYIIDIREDKIVIYLPKFLNKDKKYPIFIYLCAHVIYIELHESKITQRTVCDLIKNIFSLPSLSHSSLSNLFSDYSKKINIFIYENLDDEMKKQHDKMILEAYGKLLDHETDNKLSHHYFRRHEILHHMSLNMLNTQIKQLGIDIVRLADPQHFFKENALGGCARPRSGVKLDSG
jgi:hypothetical protein